MPKPEDKPFAIPKQLVWEAYRRVAANKGAPGVDRQALGEFETGLADNLYKIWNRMSSGSYCPPPVRAVEIPKPHGGGVRVLGVPVLVRHSCRPDRDRRHPDRDRGWKIPDTTPVTVRSLRSSGSGGGADA